MAPNDIERERKELLRQIAEVQEQTRQERERAERAEAELAPTVLAKYLELVHQHLVPPLLTNPYAANFSYSSGNVDGNYYPQELRVWDGFKQTYHQIFNQSTELFSDKSLFSSRSRIRDIQSDLAYDHDGPDFILTAIEEPAYRVVTAYLEHNGPHRWGIVDSTDGICRHVFVGVYNTGNTILPEEITQVLASAPKNFFQEVLRRKQSGTANSKQEIRERIAHLLCKTFHYMLRSGILYGYIAAGPTLIFLKINESAPQRLYFHFTPATTEQQAPELEVQDLPTAQLSIEEKKDLGKPQRPNLAYCTQTCLLGLVGGLPLDQSCPNAALHRQGSSRGKHPITREELCSLTREQLAHSLDKDCECLDREGLYGATGVLFKITLTVYGYTFVAKGVKEVNEPDIARELDIYAHVSHLQGTIVPVCLGSIALERPYPLVSFAEVTHMMLMSWGGRNLGAATWSEDVDIKKETEKTLKALIPSGVRHEDIRDLNLVWNLERQKVMVIEFDQAIIMPSFQKRKRSKKAA